MAKRLDLFIVKHTNLLVRIIAAIIVIWFITGLFAIDYVHPVLFVAIWIPLGLFAAWWSAKW